MDIDNTVNSVVTFIVMAAIGLLVLNAVFGSIGIDSGDIEVNLTESSDANDLELYNASTDELIDNKTTDGSDTYTYSEVEHGEYYLVHDDGTDTYTSNNVTHESERTDVDFEQSAETATVTDTVKQAFADVFDEVQSMTDTIYGLLILLPLVLVAAVVIGLLRQRMR